MSAKRPRKQPTGVYIAILFFSVMIFLAVIVPFFPSLDPNQFNPDVSPEAMPPSLDHPFGTDDLGRDVLLRAIFGARISLAVGFVSVGIALIVGAALGFLTGYFGGRFDNVMMRIVDVMMSIPTIFLILILQSSFKPSILNVMLVIGFTSWMGITRLVRAEVMSLKERPFILAVKARGFGSLTILRHIIPHTINPILVTATLGIGNAIMSESVLSFLGMGVQPPNASWGNMLENSLSFMFDAPWMAIIPGLLITLTVLALNYIGDTLRSRLNRSEHHA